MINTILLFVFLTICFSCFGKTKLEKIDRTNNKDTIGKTVSVLHKGITVIYQDKENNLWFGSKGLYKYDGKILILYTVEDGLCSNAIFGIQEDKNGSIYFDTPEGISKFDGKKFTTLGVVNSEFSKNDWKLQSDDLWFRMGWNKNGPLRYDGESLYQLEFPKIDLGEAFHKEYPNASYNPYGIYTMYKDNIGRLWFGTASLGVCLYDGKSISWLYEKQLSKTANGGDFGIRSIIEDENGYFWFCNARYKYKILPNSTEENGSSLINYRREIGIDNSIEIDEKERPYFMSIAEDNNGDLWMLTYNDGVWRNNGKKLIHYPINDGEIEVLLFTIYKDNQGVIWLGSHNAGVYKFNGSDFEKFKP